MLPTPLPTPSGPPVSPGPAALLSFLLTALGGGGLAAAWLRWSAARSSTPAQQQEALNAAFSGLTTDLQEERAYLTARISELERLLAESRKECLEKEGEIRSLKQWRYSLAALVERSGITIPTDLDQLESRQPHEEY